MNKHLAAVFWASAWLIVLTISQLTHADYGPPSKVFEIAATQNGQDVELVMTAVYSYGAGRVLRDGETVEAYKEIVPDDLVFPILSEAPSTYCSWMPTGWNQTEYCLSNPDTCTDCDLNGVPECVERCEPEKRFLVKDECVPPGLYTYTTDVTSRVPEGLLNQRVQIEVIDNGYSACSGNGSLDTDADVKTRVDTSAQTDVEIEGRDTDDYRTAPGIDSPETGLEDLGNDGVGCTMSGRVVSSKSLRGYMEIAWIFLGLK